MTSELMSAAPSKTSTFFDGDWHEGNVHVEEAFGVRIKRHARPNREVIAAFAPVRLDQQPERVNIGAPRWTAHASLDPFETNPSQSLRARLEERSAEPRQLALRRGERSAARGMS